MNMETGGSVRVFTGSEVVSTGRRESTTMPAEIADALTARAADAAKPAAESAAMRRTPERTRTRIRGFMVFSGYWETLKAVEDRPKCDTKSLSWESL